jgi:hypothetical protein
VIRPARGRYDQGGDRADEPDQRGSTVKKSSGVGLKASGLKAVSADMVTVSGASVVLGVTLALGVTLGSEGPLCYFRHPRRAFEALLLVS